MTGLLELTNQAYAMAKISGIYYIEAHRTECGRLWISAMPTNLYGSKDNFDLQSSHVLPAFIRRFHEAKVSGAPTVTLWAPAPPAASSSTSTTSRRPASCCSRSTTRTRSST